MQSKKTGIWGEKIAENYLKKKGYRILGKNYSIDFGSGLKRAEIDIIAKEKKTIVFVEVKAVLQKEKMGQGEWVSSFSPESKVDFKKQKKIIKAAQSWLIENKIPLDSKWRIDIISLRIILDKKLAKVRHFKNIAFY